MADKWKKLFFVQKLTRTENSNGKNNSFPIVSREILKWQCDLDYVQIISRYLPTIRQLHLKVTRLCFNCFGDGTEIYVLEPWKEWKVTCICCFNRYISPGNCPEQLVPSIPMSVRVRLVRALNFQRIKFRLHFGCLWISSLLDYKSHFNIRKRVRRGERNTISEIE